MSQFTPVIRELGEQDYEQTWHAMQSFTKNRIRNTETKTPDELWLLQHTPVFTLGLNGKRQHFIKTPSIPVIPVDRGGQVTYHGPGQLVVYFLVDLNERGYGIHDFVQRIEQAVIRLLAEYGVSSSGKENAPGVYVNGKKIAALGFRVKKGFTYHGLSLNIDMDLSPFEFINPCGYPDLEVTDMFSLEIQDDFTNIHSKLIQHLTNLL